MNLAEIEIRPLRRARVAERAVIQNKHKQQPNAMQWRALLDIGSTSLTNN